MKIIEIPGYEADDVIGTLAVQLANKDANEIYILSGDKDLYALVNEQVKVYDTQRKKISGLEETFEKFGVPANCVRDYLAICGDTSDNIPGISGIGPKKAQVLLNYFGSLEAIYENLEDLDNRYESFPEEVQKLFKGKSLEKFQEGKELAFLSQQLATLDCNVELEDFHLHDYEFHPKEIFTPELREYFGELEFHSLMGDQVRDLQNWKTLGRKVHIVGDKDGLIELEKTIHASSEIILDTETTSLNVFEAELVGVSIAVQNQIYYINLRHGGPKIKVEGVKQFLTNLLSLDIIIIGHNLKYDLQIIELFLQYGTDQTSETKIHISNEQIGLGI